MFTYKEGDLRIESISKALFSYEWIS